jgi:hypothetical protein
VYFSVFFHAIFACFAAVLREFATQQMRNRGATELGRIKSEIG